MKTARWVVPAILSLSFAPAVDAQAPSSMIVPINGTVSGLPESVSFSGSAHVTVRPAPDSAPGPMFRVAVSIELGHITGRGSSTGTIYVLSGQADLTRRFAATDMVQVTFPFSARGAAATAGARTALATFAFTFDVNTGSLVAAKASLDAPGLPPAG
jgi:hypothetical protein